MSTLKHVNTAINIIILCLKHVNTALNIIICLKHVNTAIEISSFVSQTCQNSNMSTLPQYYHLYVAAADNGEGAKELVVVTTVQISSV